MPFLADEELSGLNDLVQSDLLNTVESPRDDVFPTTAKADRSIIESVAGASVFAIDNEDLNSSDDDADIGAVEPKMPSSVPKKRGMPSLSRSETPAKAPVTKTPRSSKTAQTPKSTGRKRKAPEAEPEAEENEEPEEGSEETPEPPKKRGRKPAAPAAALATSARLAAKAASKPTRGPPKGSANKTEAKATKAAKGKGGRPKKDKTNGDSTAAEEYEVEEIIDSAVDADTKEHMYFVKWKGYAASDNTWEPKGNLAHAAELVKAFDAKKKAAAAAAKEKKPPKEKKEKAAKAVGKAKAKKELPKEKPTRVSGRTRTTRSG